MNKYRIDRVRIGIDGHPFDDETVHLVFDAVSYADAVNTSGRQWLLGVAELGTAALCLGIIDDKRHVAHILIPIIMYNCAYKLGFVRISI